MPDLCLGKKYYLIEMSTNEFLIIDNLNIDIASGEHRVFVDFELSGKRFELMQMRFIRSVCVNCIKDLKGKMIYSK
jgi:hypothetical protein